MERRIGFRCDGGDSVGAGHVARCLPLAAAFAARGWRPVFVGRYGGLAAWLLDGAMPVAEPVETPTGIDPAAGWAAVVADSYGLLEADLCALACEVPLATLAEARRCPSEGVLVDYHVDCAGEATARLLPGPRYAPLDPRLLQVRRDRSGPVECVLVTVGASASARELLAPLVDAVTARFSEARILVASGPAPLPNARVERLPYPGALVPSLLQVDVAVCAAGLTAYELACAGIPALLIAVSENQRRVARACDEAGVAIGIDALAVDGILDVPAALDRLALPQTRAALAEAGMRTFDGRGAARAAAALEERFAGRKGGSRGR